MKLENDDDTPSGTCSTPARRCAASARPKRAGTGAPMTSFRWLVALLVTLAAPAASFSQSSPPPIASFRVYRAIDSRLLGGSLGDAGTRLGNTNAGSAGGVLGYLHTEVIPSFAVAISGRRLHDIDAIAVFEVQVLNIRRARLLAPSDPPGNVNLFGPYMAFDTGVASPPQAHDQIVSYGAYVGIQDQGHNPRHAYRGDWYSFVGVCPLSAWETRENGKREKPSPCPTTPALQGICEATDAAPDGTPLCQYTYSYLGYVRLDDLVGITSKAHPLCQVSGTPRACVDYADFQRNGGVEYSAGTNATTECGDDQVPESGLPFWRGRCDPKEALVRIRALTNWSPLARAKSSADRPSSSGRAL